VGAEGSLTALLAETVVSAGKVPSASRSQTNFELRTKSARLQAHATRHKSFRDQGSTHPGFRLCGA
jgi:hypothetical protein